LIQLPNSFLNSEWRTRLEAAIFAVEGAGAALNRLRGQMISTREGAAGQLKTPIDKAAEGWILGFLGDIFISDAFLAEEQFDELCGEWVNAGSYWIVDALDGTRSFIEGYAGFCVQVAYIDNGLIRLGIVHEPARQISFMAIRESGSYRKNADGSFSRLLLPHIGDWPGSPVFVDSTYPKGTVGRLLADKNGNFLECGSIGLKICRVAEGAAHLFIKELIFKTWDVAPGDLILSEAGGKLGLWSGDVVLYDRNRIHYANVIATPKDLFNLVLESLKDS
jgi:3'(2'), 5'-bisphosphate nucleotidase